MTAHVKIDNEFQIAARHVELLTGSAETECRFRLIHDRDRHASALKLCGKLADLWPQIKALNAQGYGVFIVVNAGGDADAEITQIRACFVDADNLSLPDEWHVQPDFLVIRDDTHWHAYWLCNDLPKEDFTGLQKQLAAHYGTDPSVCNLSRVMRLAGTMHCKGEPIRVNLRELAEPWEISCSANDLRAGLPEIPAHTFTPASTDAPDIEPDTPANIGRAVTHAQTHPVLREGVGDHSDDAAIKLLTELGDLGLSQERAAAVAHEDWGERCGFDQDWIAEKAANAYRYRKSPIGIHAVQSAQDVFGDAIARLKSEQTSDEFPRPLGARELAQGNFPRAEYLHDGLLLKDHVNLLYGAGGVGKTLLALQIAVAVAAGLPLFGRNTKQAPVLLVLAEDGAGETKARLVAICQHLGINLADLPIRIWPLPGHDITLASIADDGAVKPAPFLDRLNCELRDYPGSLVILDSFADIATLNESQRLPVNAFLKRVLGGLCTTLRATILVLAHPSKASQADGSNYSGSTAFNNAVRNRLTLEQPVDTSERRLLTVAKANYGAAGGKIELFLAGQVFLTANDAGQAEREKAEHEAVLAVALGMIDRGVPIVRGNGSGQKPADVAAEVLKQHGLRIEPKRVLEILNAAERAGRLEYRNGGHSHRGQKAGFARKDTQ